MSLKFESFPLLNPWVVEKFVKGWSLFWICLKNTLNEINTLLENISSQYNIGNIEYFEARDINTLELVYKSPMRLLIATYINKTRLIDNIQVEV